MLHFSHYPLFPVHSKVRSLSGTCNENFAAFRYLKAHTEPGGVAGTLQICIRLVSSINLPGNCKYSTLKLTIFDLFHILTSFTTHDHVFSFDCM